MAVQPRLPPEILYNIMNYLNDPLDVVAASLVCTQWYYTFHSDIRRLFSTTRQNFTWYLRNPPTRQRFAALLFTARQLGLPLCDAFETHDLRLEAIHDIFAISALKSPMEPDVMELFTILDLTIATHLRITIYRASFVLPHLPVWQSLLYRLQRMGGTVTALELLLPWTPWTTKAQLLCDDDLASIVHAARNSLQSVDLKHDPGSATMKALMCCQNVRAVRFSKVSPDLMWTLTNQWRSLREAELNLEHVSISAIVGTLCLSATTLEKLCLHGPEASTDEGDAVALMHLLHQCRSLRKVCFIDLICVDNDLLRDLASSCQELDEVCVYVGSAVENAEPRVIQWHRGPDGDTFVF